MEMKMRDEIKTLLKLRQRLVVEECEADKLRSEKTRGIEAIDLAVALLERDEVHSQGAGESEAGPVPSSPERAEESNPYPPGTYSAQAWDYDRRRREATAKLVAVAKAEGRDAFHEGEKLCPYAMPGDLHDAWWEGFEAEKAAESRPEAEGNKPPSDGVHSNESSQQPPAPNGESETREVLNGENSLTDEDRERLHAFLAEPGVKLYEGEDLTGVSYAGFWGDDKLLAYQIIPDDLLARAEEPVT